MSCNFILNLIFLIIGWLTSIAILIVAILMEYKPYQMLKPNEFIFFQTDDLLKQNQTSNYGYMIRNGTNLSDLSMCTRFSRESFTRINQFLDNYIIAAAYFTSVCLFLLSECMDTFVFAKKYCYNNTDTNEYDEPNETNENENEYCGDGDLSSQVKLKLKMFLFRFGSFLIKINSISGFFILGIIDYDNIKECFQLKVAEFFLDVAYYSIYVTILSLLVSIFLLLAQILILVALFNVCLSSIFCCNFNCCRLLKVYFQFVGLIALFLALLVLANICIYFILCFGKADARILNALMTINFIKTLAVKFSSCCDNFDC